MYRISEIANEQKNSAFEVIGLPKNLYLLVVQEAWMGVYTPCLFRTFATTTIPPNVHHLGELTYFSSPFLYIFVNIWLIYCSSHQVSYQISD